MYIVSCWYKIEYQLGKCDVTNKWNKSEHHFLTGDKSITNIISDTKLNKRTSLRTL